MPIQFKSLFLIITLSGLAACKKSDNQPAHTVPDIYVEGTVSNFASRQSTGVYWKNNRAHAFADPATNSYASDMILQDTNVYMAGQSVPGGGYIGSATYWINGYASTVQYNSVYFAGTDNGQACYWKNEKEFKLPRIKGYSDGSTACKIIVVP